MQPPAHCMLGIRQKLNTIDAGISGSALVQENLRATPGLVSGERIPVNQIFRPLDNVAQTCASGIAELEAGRGQALCITESDRRWRNDMNGNCVRGFGSAIVTGYG